MRGERESGEWRVESGERRAESGGETTNGTNYHE